MRHRSGGSKDGLSTLPAGDVDSGRHLVTVRTEQKRQSSRGWNLTEVVVRTASTVANLRIYAAHVYKRSRLKISIKIH